MKVNRNRLVGGGGRVGEGGGCEGYLLSKPDPLQSCDCLWLQGDDGLAYLSDDVALPSEGTIIYSYRARCCLGGVPLCTEEKGKSLSLLKSCSSLQPARSRARESPERLWRLTPLSLARRRPRGREWEGILTASSTPQGYDDCDDLSFLLA